MKKSEFLKFQHDIEMKYRYNWLRSYRSLVGKIAMLILVALVVASVIYLTLGTLGLLPDYFYEQCQGIDVETAMKRGCCEDRSPYQPISIVFGADNCDRYRIEVQEVTENE